MEAVDMTLKLFRAMDKHERRSELPAPGRQIDDTGLVEKLVPNGMTKAGAALTGRF